MESGEERPHYVRRSRRKPKVRKAPRLMPLVVLVAVVAIGALGVRFVPRLFASVGASATTTSGPAASAPASARPRESRPKVALGALPVAVRLADELTANVTVRRSSAALVDATVTVQAAPLDYLGASTETRTVAVKKLALQADRTVVPLSVRFRAHGRTRLVARVQMESVSGPAVSAPLTTFVAGDKAIALTWDDGPSANTTPMVLKALRDAGAHATFFVSARLADRHPNLVKREAAEGNEIGSHGATHTDLTKQTDEGLAEEVRIGRESIAALTGVPPKVLRPPLGAVNDRVRTAIREGGMEPVLWDIDTMDWHDQDAELIEQRVLESARDGLIVLMHDSGGQATSTGVAAVPIITKLQAEGFDLVTIEELKTLRGDEELPSKF